MLLSFASLARGTLLDVIDLCIFMNNGGTTKNLTNSGYQRYQINRVFMRGSLSHPTAKFIIYV